MQLSAPSPENVTESGDAGGGGGGAACRVFTLCALGRRTPYGRSFKKPLSIYFACLNHQTLFKITPPFDLNREAIVAAFQADASQRVLLLSVGVGGVGLNLQCANHVVFVESSWTPAVDDQAAARAHRMCHPIGDASAYCHYCVRHLYVRVCKIAQCGHWKG